MSPDATNPADGAAGLGEFALQNGVNTPDNSQNETFLQAPLPSFFEMVAENARGHLQVIATLCGVCAGFIDSADPEGFADARRRLIGQARAFADVSRPIADPAILSRERADSFERQAENFDNLALILRGEAAELRAIVGRSR